MNNLQEENINKALKVYKEKIFFLGKNQNNDENKYFAKFWLIWCNTHLNLLDYLLKDLQKLSVDFENKYQILFKELLNKRKRLLSTLIQVSIKNDNTLKIIAEHDVFFSTIIEIIHEMLKQELIKSTIIKKVIIAYS